MSFKDILVCLQSYPDPTGPAAIDQAVGVAAALGDAATAIAVHVRIPLRSNRIADLLVNLSNLAREEEARSLANADAVVKRFVQQAGPAGLRAEHDILHVDLYETAAELTRLARTRDLVLIPQERPGDGQGALAEAMIFGSGRPVVVFQAGGEAAAPMVLEKVMVAWDGSRAAARAVADAGPVIRRAGEVRILTVLNEKPLAQEGVGHELARHLARIGVAATVDEFDGRGQTIGEALSQRAGDWSADLLVMGAFGHSRAQEFILGGATQSLLTRPSVPLLLSH